MATIKLKIPMVIILFYDNFFRADEGCLQWFTGLGGQFQSFNKLQTNPMMISNLLYSVCIRKEEGT